MNLTVGFVLTNGLVVAEPFDNYEHPAWWLNCPRCHSRVFATTEMIEESNVPNCKECATNAEANTRGLERNKIAEDMQQAGRGNEQAYEDLIVEERAEQDAQMLRRLGLL